MDTSENGGCKGKRGTTRRLSGLHTAVARRTLFMDLKRNAADDLSKFFPLIGFKKTVWVYNVCNRVSFITLYTVYSNNNNNNVFYAIAYASYSNILSLYTI